MNQRKPVECKTIEECAACGTRVIYWSIVGNLFLAFIKLLTGILTNSAGLTADGFQSFFCLIGCVLIMYGVTISRRRRDERYPYGYGKVEFAVALVVFSVLFGLGLFLCVSSILLILRREFPEPNILGLPVAVLSVLLNLQMYKYSLCAGNRLGSAGLIANAYQNKADMVSSCGVCAGIVLSQFGKGFGIFDLLAVFLVGLIIIKDSIHHWIMNLKVLMDRTPEPQYKEIVNRIISEVFTEKLVRSIKIKRTGTGCWLGIGIDLPESDNIGEMGLIASGLRELLRREIDWVDSVDFFLDVPVEEETGSVPDS